MLFTKRKQYEMSLKRRADDVETQNEQLEKKIDTLQYNVNKLIERNYQIFAIEKDKLGEPVIVYKIPDQENYSIYVKNSQSKLDEEYDFVAVASHNEAEKNLRIKELNGTTLNQGYGSICMSYLKELSHFLRVKKIVVTINEPESKERVEHFLKKHGFIIDSQKTYAEWTRPYR